MDIRRRELYEAVWTTPIRTLARKWGLSDVGLAKICRKHDIPTPPVGHWAKVAVGCGIKPPSLAGQPDILVTFGTGQSLVKHALSADSQGKLPQALAAAAALSSGGEPAQLARWTRKTARALNKKPDQYGFLIPSKEAFDVAVSEASEERSLHLLNVLETALTVAGMAWEADSKTLRVAGKMGGETISFQIAERYKRMEHIEKHPKYEWMNKRIFSYTFSGELTIRIDGSYDGRKSWSDGKLKRLEEKLPEVIEGFLAAAEAKHRRTIERQEREKQWAEQARLRAQRERAAWEEKIFLEAIAKEAETWSQANAIRQYAAHLRQTASKLGITLSEDGEAWIAKVERTADRLDPILKRLGEKL